MKKLKYVLFVTVMPILHTWIQHKYYHNWRLLLLGYFKFVLLLKYSTKFCRETWCWGWVEKFFKFLNYKDITSMCFCKLWHESTLFHVSDKMQIPRLNCVFNMCCVTGLLAFGCSSIFCILVDSKVFNISKFNHTNGDFLFFGQERFCTRFFLCNADSTCIACWLCRVYAADCSLTLLWCSVHGLHVFTVKVRSSSLKDGFNLCWWIKWILYLRKGKKVYSCRLLSVVQIADQRVFIHIGNVLCNISWNIFHKGGKRNRLHTLFLSAMNIKLHYSL